MKSKEALDRIYNLLEKANRVSREVNDDYCLIYKDLMSLEEIRNSKASLGYIPSCPLGYSDCVHDPSYVKYIDLISDSSDYLRIFGDLTVEEASYRYCKCSLHKSEKGFSCEKYDDEDK